MRVTEESLWAGIAAARLAEGLRHQPRRGDIRTRAGRLRDRRGVHRPRDRVGDAPAAQRPQCRTPGRGAKLVKGLALAVEPMVTLDTPNTRTLDDDWTVVTTDGSWAAHYEHTFTLTELVPGSSRRSMVARRSSRRSASRTAATDRASPRCAVPVARAGCMRRQGRVPAPPRPRVVGTERLSETEQVVETLMRALEEGDCDTVKDVVVDAVGDRLRQINEAAGMLENEGVELDKVTLQGRSTAEATARPSRSLAQDLPPRRSTAARRRRSGSSSSTQLPSD